MILPALFFYLFAGICVASAVMVIVSRNPVHSVLFLILAFVNASGLFMLMGAEFLAMILVVVYVGAVAVLFLFVIMMLDINLEELRGGFTRYAWFGWIAAAVVMLEVAGVVLTKKLGIDVTRGAAPLPPNYSNTQELGALLYGKYAYPLEIAAMLLLVAMVAAITLTLRHRPGLKKQNIGNQVAARASERVRIVKMDSEQRK